MLGWNGLLTSSSTRIDGLVSITDVATGRLDAVPEDDPVGALERLDRRIERNDRWRLPLTFALGAVVLVLAFLRPALAIRAILVALAANLWLAPAVAIAAGWPQSCFHSVSPAPRCSAPTSCRWGSMPRRSRSLPSARRSRAASTA